jgi:4-hydroxybenzoyl-CoA thioesterase
MPLYRQRVEFGDCDPAQVAYYPNFFLWLDRSTHALFETAGVPMREIMQRRRIGVPPVHVKIDFLSPAAWGDMLEIVSAVEKLGQHSVTITHLIKGEDGRSIARATETRAFVSMEHAPGGRATAIQIPNDVRDALSRLLRRLISGFVTHDSLTRHGRACPGHPRL